jgi:hypothetical protein
MNLASDVDPSPCLICGINFGSKSEGQSKTSTVSKRKSCVRCGAPELRGRDGVSFVEGLDPSHQLKYSFSRSKRFSSTVYELGSHLG